LEVRHGEKEYGPLPLGRPGTGRRQQEAEGQSSEESFRPCVRRARLSVVMVFVLSVNVARAPPEQHPGQLCHTLRAEIRELPCD